MLGVNDCNLESDFIGSDCRVSYRGFKPPTLRWLVSNSGNSVLSGVTCQTIGITITCSVVLQTRSLLNQTNLICRIEDVKISSGQRVHCNTSKINVLCELNN